MRVLSNNHFYVDSLSGEKLRFIFENAKVGMAICNADNNRLEMVNPAFAAIHGYEVHELIGAAPGEVFAPECLLKLSEHESASPSACSLGDISFETTHIRKDGSPIPVSVHISVIRDENGKIRQRIANIIDITERVKHEREIKALTENLPGFAFTYELSGEGKESFLYVSPGIKSTFGLDAEEVLENPDSAKSLIHPDDYEVFLQSLIASSDDLSPFRIEFRIVHPKKGVVWLESRGTPIPQHDGSVQWYGIALDITEQKIIATQIEFMAQHDALTGLPNRIYAKEKMNRAIEKAIATESLAALLFIDLDGFKTINDSLGHSTGDKMLQNVAQRLGRHLSPSDTLSRQGGDEFLIILSDVLSKEQVIDVARKIIAEFQASFFIDSQELSTSASIGIALYPDHGETFETLLQNADTAMYRSKDLGKNCCSLFSADMNRHILHQLKIENELKAALNNGEFILFYQPQVDLNHRTIVGAEALLRWNHPTLGMIAPNDFIPIAESSGLIVPIGRWVIEEACRQIAKWRSQQIDLGVAVNISAVQFKRGDLIAIVENALFSSDIPPHTLELELTESMMMNDIDNTLQSVQALKSLGVRLSIDDFGTGYSSLAYLKRFSVDKLKIDQSFVRDIVHDQEDSVIVQTIIQMARNLNLRTTAEGVENTDVLQKIDAFGCDEVQGYHFAKPMSAEAFEEFLTEFTLNQTAKERDVYHRTSY